VRFVAIDVETANTNRASICQIGIVRFEHGQIAEEWETLVDPEDVFAPMNISIHGISPRMVSGQPKLPALADDLRRMLEGSICVSHSHFDRGAMTRAFERYAMPPIESEWIDTVRVARRTWPNCGLPSYGLANVCRMLGHPLRHHDALEDARACGTILVRAMQESGTELADWMKPKRAPRSRRERA
jgi:DNA polymerase-3 subunit epsilon